MTKKSKKSLLKDTKSVLVEQIFQLQREISILENINRDLLVDNDKILTENEKVRETVSILTSDRILAQKKVSRLDYELERKDEEIHSLREKTLELEEEVSKKFTLTEIVLSVLLTLLIALNV